MSSLDRILPFLKPIEGLLIGPSVAEVMVNDGGKRVYRTRGRLRRWPIGHSGPELAVAIKNIARACGDRDYRGSALLDARLGRLRVAAMFPPCAVAGAVLTIRKFTRRTLAELVRLVR
jgi:Flp pilus assembly CpaF family ATPase